MEMHGETIKIKAKAFVQRLFRIYSVSERQFRLTFCSTNYDACLS